MFPLNYILFLQIVIFLFITPGTPRIVIVSHSMNYGVIEDIHQTLMHILAQYIRHKFMNKELIVKNNF